MTINQKNQQVNKIQIKNLKLLLIVLTIVQLTYFSYLLLYSETDHELIFNFPLKWIIAFLNYMVAGIFLWYNWKKLPIQKKKKLDNMWMILFLGIIGMWLWIPNKSEINEMNKSSNLQNI